MENNVTGKRENSNETFIFQKVVNIVSGKGNSVPLMMKIRIIQSNRLE